MSVCLFVTRRYSIETAKHDITKLLQDGWDPPFWKSICRIPIWRTFGRIPWHVIPQSPATLQGVIIPSVILKIVFSHILFFFCFLMQIRLWRAAAFVSSSIHLFGLWRQIQMSLLTNLSRHARFSVNPSHLRLLLPTGLPLDNGTGPDLSRSSVYFSFTFYFFVYSMW